VSDHEILFAVAACVLVAYMVVDENVQAWVHIVIISENFVCGLDVCTMLAYCLRFAGLLGDGIVFTVNRIHVNGIMALEEYY